MEKDAQATAGLLTNALTSREAGEGGQKGQVSGLAAKVSHACQHACCSTQGFADRVRSQPCCGALQETTSGLNAHDCIMARHALHDIQQCHASILGRVEQFKSDLQQQRNL